MRRAAFRLALIMMGLVAGAYGCSSSSGPLDEIGQRYVSSVTIEDNGEETLDIDVVQSMCDNETEEFTNAFAILSLSVDADAPGLTLQSYSIQYIPLDSPDGNGNLVTPPELVSPEDGWTRFEVGAGESGQLEVTCMSIDTKEEFVNSWPAGVDYPLYTIRITFRFENTAGEDIDIVVDKTVYLGNYNNC